MTTPSLRSRVLLIDILKAMAAQFIVLHHFAWYGLFDHPPRIDVQVDWLVNYGRYAVAVFIATSGFLAAQTLPFSGIPPGDRPLCLIRDRYLRLIGPFFAALLLAVVCDAFARSMLDGEEALGQSPSAGQLLAHLLMLHGLLGIESLSAGVWYVAIDFQLYALFVLLLWAGHGVSRRLASADFSNWGAPAMVLAVALASLLHFNRDARWDDTALYFFGSYAFGIASGWAIRSGQRARYRLLIFGIGLLALWVELRARIAVATLTALLLGFGRLVLARREVRWVHYLGGTSFALFLVHFPLYLAVAAALRSLQLTTPAWDTAGLVICWVISMAGAHGFHRWIELPYGRWRKHRARCQPRPSAAG